jgi:hypothetical protein
MGLLAGKAQQQISWTEALLVFLADFVLETFEKHGFAGCFGGAKDRTIMNGKITMG